MNTVSVTLSTDGTASVHPSAQRCNDSVAHKQQLIESALDKYTQFTADCPQLLSDAIRYSLLTPGKRLRPMLVMLASEACGGNADIAVPAACAVEMIHTYSLIHDDLPSMDNDDTRRGRPTCHKKFGEGVATLAGDALQALAFEILAKEITPPEVAVACCASLAAASGPTALVGGQCDDIREELASGSRELVKSIHNRKTGALFLASLKLGGLVAHASQAELDALRNFGSNLGLAFQITDDLLDVREDCRGAQAMKKGDWGKLTYPNLVGEKQSRSDVAKLVTAACEALKPLGTNARSLQALATFVSERV